MVQGKIQDILKAIDASEVVKSEDSKEKGTVKNDFK